MDVITRIQQAFENGEDFNFMQSDIDELIKLAKKVDIYEGALDLVEDAMHKVGWNNSRIEDAFDEMNEQLKAL